jgi:hypothetical protein
MSSLSLPGAILLGRLSSSPYANYGKASGVVRSGRNFSYCEFSGSDIECIGGSSLATSILHAENQREKARRILKNFLLRRRWRGKVFMPARLFLPSLPSRYAVVIAYLAIAWLSC